MSNELTASVGAASRAYIHGGQIVTHLAGVVPTGFVVAEAELTAEVAAPTLE